MAGAVAESLLEREHEIARLTAVIEGAARGVGTAVLVEGPPGIGKTSLLDAGAALAAERALSVLRARGGELERGLPFGIARDLLARRVARAPDDERSRLLSGAAAVAAPALGLSEAHGLPAEEPAINHGLTWLLADLAEQQPLAVIVDDIQWADAASAAWLLHLARRIGDLPVVLLLGARSRSGEPEPPGLGALRQLVEVERIRPGPLGGPAVAALVRSFYFPDADDDFIAACHRAAGGNPFHTQALLDAAAAREIPATGAGATALEQLAPEAIQHSVSAALRRAGPEAVAVADACAILGEAAESRHVALLAELDPVAAAAAADRLTEETLLAAGHPLRFVHPLLLAVVREAMPRARRAELHRRAAHLLAEEGDHRLAAAHLLEVEPEGDQAVVRTLLAAASEAASEGAMRHAAELLERVLAEPPPPDERPRLLGFLGRARLHGRLPGAVEPLLTAADAAPSPGERGDLLATAAWSAILQSPQHIDEVVRRVVALPPDAGDGRLRALGAAAVAQRWAGLPADPPTAELIAIADTLSGATPGERELLGAAAMAASSASALPADKLRDLIFRALREPGQTLAPAAISACQAAGVAGASAAVLPALSEAISACERRGNQFGLFGLTTARALVNVWLGRLREAEADARVMWAYGREDQLFTLRLYAMVCVLAARGLIDEGKQLLAENRHVQIGQNSFQDSLVQFAAGWLAVEAGDLDDDAVASIVGLDETMAAHGIDHLGWGLLHRPLAVEALVRTGETERARTLAEKELRFARQLGSPGVVGYALRCMGLVEGGEKGRRLLEEAVPLLDEADERDRLARTLIDLGRAIRLEGKPTEARDPLRRALELAEECGAELVAQRALEELRATGAKPRRRALSGPESLTPSEARVAQLAADGRTNREVAQALFVSTKTVETHLGHIYAKLDIPGRSGLAQALARSA